jgi:anti-sigma factor RsiW
MDVHRCERGAIVTVKRVWKPLDVGGFRLYEVTARYVPRPQEEKQAFIVPAKSPSDAARLIREMYERAGQGGYWDVFGKALNVYVPETWWTNGVLCPVCEASEVARAVAEPTPVRSRS